MFNSTNKMPDINELSHFIEKPSQNCTDEELTKGVSAVLVVLEKNPFDLMNILSNHLFIPTTYLLSDLAVKMNKEQCIEKLEPLFTKYFDKLIDQCVWNQDDLKRFIAVAPHYLDKAMEAILSSDSLMQRFFENSKNPAETLEEICKDYPLYAERFSSYYNEHFNSSHAFLK